MANQEHLDILAKGVEAWNNWRDQNRYTVPDLTDADLSRFRLHPTPFAYESDPDKEVSLYSVDFLDARLHGCDLSDLDLWGANFRNADLSDANLSKAVLRDAEFERTSLRGANLSWAHFQDSELVRTDLAGAYLMETLFIGVDLSEAVGLADVDHHGPSTIDIHTLRKSRGLPLAFLRGAGLPDPVIDYLPTLFRASVEFYSCFISYSTKDQNFADRLYTDLQARGVRCWFAPHDVQGGRKLHEQIDEAIRVYDKLLLILSEASMNSPWVKTEIANARAREMQQKRQTLFPITLVPFARIREWKCFDADTGIDSAREIREYYVPDFSNWKDHDLYSAAFERLVRDLKAAPGERDR